MNLAPGIFRKGWLPALLLAAPLFAYIVYPLGAMLLESVTLPVSTYRARDMGWEPDPARQPLAAPLRRVFAEAQAREAIWRTVMLSVLSVVAGAAWGLGLVLLWCRREFPGRRFFAALGYAPILMPPLVGTLAFWRLLGEVGVLWRVFSDGQAWVSPFARVLIVHTYAFGLFTYAYVSAALEDADASREEAARSLGAGRLRTFFAAVWPAIAPALLAAALLTFMAAAASFSAPKFLDTQSRYLTVEILEVGDAGMQRALSVVLACLSLSMLPLFLYVDGRSQRGAQAALGLKGAARGTLPRASRLEAGVRIGLSCAAAVLLLAPPAMVVFGALFPDVRPVSWLKFASVFVGEDAWENIAALGRSVSYGAVATLFDLALAIGIALALRRASALGAFGMEFPVMLALALPGSVIAIALLSAFNAPSPLAAGIPLGGTAAILILAYAIRDLPLAVRPVRAALHGIGADLENAAAGLGAPRVRILWRVTLPLMLPSLLAAGLICFVTAAGEYATSALLAGVQTMPVSVRIAELFRTEQWKPFALALALMLLSSISIAVARLLMKRRA